MILSREDVLALISIPKYSNERGIDLSKDNNTITMHAESDASLSFRLHVKTSKRINVKLTCHHDHEYIGLIRIDFYSGHKNPETITTDVPDILHKYIGKRFSAEEHHVHIYVNGFDLDWALPITDHEFRVKNIKNQSDIVDSVQEFSRLINLKTPLMIAQSPLGKIS
ncbi:hypothetical protein VU05_01360 [Desulfobulbus sp. F1]|nr:hypothetical protein [Desulfobulbus sp. F1]